MTHTMLVLLAMPLLMPSPISLPSWPAAMGPPLQPGRLSSTVRLVPLADPDTMEHSNIISSASGLLRGSVPCPMAPFKFPPSSYLTLFCVTPIPALTYLNRIPWWRWSWTKKPFYLSKYHEQGFAFALMASNSFGQLGSEFLHFLWALPLAVSGRSCSTQSPYSPTPRVPVLPILSESESPDEHNSSQPQMIRFKPLHGILVQARLHLLTAVYELITHRVYGRRKIPLPFDSQFWETSHTLSAVCGPQPDTLPLCLSQGQSFVSLPANASYAAVAAVLPNSVHTGNLRHLYHGRRDPGS
jgi:hypothetical protein